MNNNHEKQIKAIESATTDMQRGMAPNAHSPVMSDDYTIALADMQYALARLVIARHELTAAVKKVEAGELGNAGKQRDNVDYFVALVKHCAEKL